MLWKRNPGILRKEFCLVQQVEETMVAQESQTISVAAGPRKGHLKYDIILILTTIIWGGSFLVTKNALHLIGPFTYLGLSHGVATLFLLVTFRKHWLRITRKELIGGLLVGIVFFAGYAVQTLGIQWTTVSKAGFITGLYVPLVPLFSLLFLRQRISLMAGSGILLAVLGLFLLSINEQFNLIFGPGEWLLLTSAVAFAIQIILISRFAPKMDPINLVIIQLALTFLLSLLAMPFHAEPIAAPPAAAWGSVLFLGIIDIACTQLAINWAQQFVSSTRAALLYSLEPMWSAFFGLLLAGDILSLTAWIGCGSIFLGMIVGRLDGWHFRRKSL